MVFDWIFRPVCCVFGHDPIARIINRKGVKTDTLLCRTCSKKLKEKINAMVSRYENMKNENESLRTEVMNAKAQSEAKDAAITRLEDENALKDIEIEEIVKKIESALT